MIPSDTQQDKKHSLITAKQSEERLVEYLSGHASVVLKILLALQACGIDCWKKAIPDLYVTLCSPFIAKQWAAPLNENKIKFLKCRHIKFLESTGVWLNFEGNLLWKKIFFYLLYLHFNVVVDGVVVIIIKITSAFRPCPLNSQDWSSTPANCDYKPHPSSTKVILITTWRCGERNVM